MKDELKIIPLDLLDSYCQKVDDSLGYIFDSLEDAELSTDTFSFYTSVASVFSSKIEGEEIDLGSYVKHKRFGIQFHPDHTKKIDDLYNAYSFAEKTSLTHDGIMEAHKLLTKHILSKPAQGVVRNQNMYVTTQDGRIEYVACDPTQVTTEFEKFTHDIERLLEVKLTTKEVFFFASMLHLIFVKIHPFQDGNGRTGRLIEKWFLKEKLGAKAWFIQSEKNYYECHETYYSNLRTLGLEYEQLDYSKAFSFLLMLSGSLTKS